MAEEMFAIDSIATAELLATPGLNQLNRQIIAVAAIHNTVSSFYRQLPDEFDWARSNLSIGDKRAVSSEYRKLKALLTRLLNGSETNDSAYAKIVDKWQTHHIGLRGCADRLHSLYRDGILSIPPKEICNVLVHMQCNRLLTPGRQKERSCRALLANTLETLIKSRRT